ncbi:MAG: ABC transporter permease subunit, partial [Candidatus Obscuribacter sp.]|nr:ABC transporter permease subunit [Candidatus Obscuribacter sp.]
MNRAICVNTWREFKSNKVRLILLTLLFLGPLAHFTWRRCFSPLEIQDEMISFSAMSIFFALIWGIGVVGRERQHGTITLVLARPVTITNYIISKWIAVGLAAAIC